VELHEAKVLAPPVVPTLPPPSPVELISTDASPVAAPIPPVGQLPVAAARHKRRYALIAVVSLVVCVYVLFAGFAQFRLHDAKVVTTKEAVVGDTVLFGTYNGTPLEWQVLRIEDNKALLITKKCIVDRPYNDEYTSVTWETCSLRAYLNTDFYDGSFSDKQKNSIATTTVINADNASYKTPGGNTTEDKVFLLSMDEAGLYFADDADRVANNGSWTWWWLRSPGYAADRTTFTDGYGSLNDIGRRVTESTGGMRPVIWVNLEP
jgi:hypothetical protein